MTKDKKIRLLGVFVAVAAALVLALGLLLPRMLDPEAHRTALIRHLKTALNRDVLFARGEFSVWPLPTFTFTDIHIKEKDGQTPFVTADRLQFRLSLPRLLFKKIVLTKLVLDRPRITLARTADGSSNVDDLLVHRETASSFETDRIHIRDGSILFTDHRFAPAPLTISLQGINLSLHLHEHRKAVDFTLDATVNDPVKSGTVALGGSITFATASKSLLDSRIEATVTVKGLNAGPYWPYVSRHLPFGKLTGRLDLDVRWSGTFKVFDSSGSLTLHDLHLDYPPVFTVPLRPKTVRADYALKRSNQSLEANRLDIVMDGLQVKGHFLFKDMHTDDPLVDAKASATEFRWEAFRHYVPYGIIPEDVANFIEQKIKGGFIHLEEGRLHGRMSQITHMEKGNNSDALYIRARVREAVLAYASDVPTITNVAGILELKGKDFILREMTGNIGNAPFSLDGRLADYCLDTPTRYPFTMRVSPTAKEVSWLLGENISKAFNYAGTSTLLLSGDGPTANYSLSGSWDLSNAGYAYSDWLVKPAGTTNKLTLEVRPGKQGIDFSSIRYDLPPLSLTASAKYRYAGKHRLSLIIDTNTVQLEDMVPTLPKIKSFEPRGSLKATLRARSGSTVAADLSWRGAIELAGVSFKTADPFKAAGTLTGRIRLRGDVLEAPQMTLQVSGSTISVKARIANLKNPTYYAAFSTKLVDAADLGLHHPNRPVKLKNLNGSIALTDRDLKIEALGFQFNDSILNIRGDVKNLFDRPKAEIKVVSSYLDMSDILILSDLKGTDQSGTVQTERHTTNPVSDIQAQSDHTGRLIFRMFETRLNIDGNIIDLRDLVAGVLDGSLAGDGRIDLTDSKSPRYHFNFALERLSAQQGLDFFAVKDRLITGTLSAWGNLAAEGPSVADFKKTAVGKVQIKMEEGTLVKFAVLSKIFSILNISQLFKFQLPDMVRGGMPYNTVTATFSVKEGIVSTRDLFIRSNAMNLSAVGAIDMNKEEFLETAVGIQPLQTVDKAVSLLPVIGWILTDENRSVMSVHFEVKGSLNDPSVRAVPVKSLTRGVFDIFRNVFQLPAKLFTDTGEVLFGR